MSHHKSQWQMLNRIKVLLARLQVMVEHAQLTADEKHRDSGGGQYYRGRAHGVVDVAELVIEELGPICDDPEPLSGYLDCLLCEGKGTMRLLETVPDDKPGSIYGCMVCGYETRR